MNILNIEDNIYKQFEIRKALENGGLGKIEIQYARNLEDGINMIEESINIQAPYDLIITDMWYPKSAGADESESGEALINMASEKGWSIPIILCSSVNYRFPEILGSVHYSANSDWEFEIVNLIKKIK